MTTVVNAGNIRGNLTMGNAVGLVSYAGGSVTNQAGGTIAGFYSIYNNAGSLSVVNTGLLLGDGFGVVANNGTVINQATIMATGTGLPGKPGYGVGLLASGTIGNLGSLSLIEGFIGVASKTSGTVTNAGTIVSNQGSIGVAVKFGAGSNRLIDDPGAVFIGSINGGSGTAVMELASAGSAGSISGFGSGVTNFTSLVFDTGARWTVAGNASASGLGTLGISGFAAGDTIDLTGFVAVSRTFASNSLVLTDGGGTHVTLGIQGSFATGDFAVANNGSVTTIILGQNALAYGQTIDVAGTLAASETVTAGVLTLLNGGGTAVGTIAVGTSLSTGDFSLTPDGSGGTDVIVSTVFGSYSSGVTLLANPTTIASTAQASNTADKGVAVTGPAGTNWTLTNLGSVSETGAGGVIGISFAAAGTIINTGSISIDNSVANTTGVSLAAGGSVTNRSGGAISGYGGIVASAAVATVANTGGITGNLTAAGGVAISLLANAGVIAGN